MPTVHSKDARMEMVASKDQAHLLRTSSSLIGLLRRLLKFMSPRSKLNFELAFTSLFVSSITNLLLPRITGLALDFAIRRRSVSLISGSSFCKRDLLCVGGVFAVGALSSWFRVFSFGVATHDLARTLRERFIRRVLTRDLEFCNNNRVGSAELVKRFSEDVDIAANVPSKNLAAALRGFNSTAGSVALLFYLSHKLAVVAFVLIPLVGFGGVFYTRRAKQCAKLVHAHHSIVLVKADERIRNIETVRLYGKEEEEIENLTTELKEIEKESCESSFADGVFMAFVNGCTSLSLVAVLSFGGLLIRRKEMSVGSLASFALYTTFVGLGVSSLAQAYGDLLKSTDSLERVLEIVEKQVVERDKKKTGRRFPLEEGTGITVELDNVVFGYHYNSSSCLDNYNHKTDENTSKSDNSTATTKSASSSLEPLLAGVSLVVSPTEIVAIKGVSGAGKSTIAKLLALLYLPSSGRILFEGCDISELDVKWLRTEVIGIVSQEPIIFSLSVEHNISYGNQNASKEQVVNAAKLANALDFIQALPNGFDTKLGEGGLQLSVGQKQRIGIARTLVKNSKLLVLDETTSHLDYASERLIHQTIKSLAKTRTVIIIAHSQSAIDMADRVYTLQQGKVAE